MVNQSFPVVGFPVGLQPTGNQIDRPTTGDQTDHFGRLLVGFPADQQEKSRFGSLGRSAGKPNRATGKHHWATKHNTMKNETHTPYLCKHSLILTIALI